MTKKKSTTRRKTKGSKRGSSPAPPKPSLKSPKPLEMGMGNTGDEEASEDESIDPDEPWGRQ